MPLVYPIKRVFRSWKLFAALLIGVIFASTFFAGLNVKANLAAKQVMEEQLTGIYTDMESNAFLNYSHPAAAKPYILGVDGVTDVEYFYRSYQPSLVQSDNFTNTQYIQTVAVPNSSSLYSGLTGIPPEGLGENETYILDTSTADPYKSAVQQLEVGDVIQTALQFRTANWGDTTDVHLNLTVAGFVKLTDEAYSKISGNSFYISPTVRSSPGVSFGFMGDLMFVSWENTIDKLWKTLPDTALETQFLVSVDHAALLNPWDSQGSANNLQTVAEKIQDTILGKFEYAASVHSNLDFAVAAFQNIFPVLLITFLVVTLPVFILAWYLGSTVSDVSFNLRRREIGLLSTKGLSNGQIQRMFFTEALLIGIVGGLIGVVGGAILNQVYTGFNLETLFNPQTVNPNVVVFTVIFGVFIAFFSVFFSARRATSLPTVDALKEYVSIDAAKPYRKRLPWIAFILGAYKIVVFLLGVNVPNLLNSVANLGGGSFITYLLLLPAALFDQVLTFIGPLLFFWGFTKLFVQNSLKFQQLTSKVSRVAGDLGALAAKNVRRNPARTAAVAFIVALIIGYGVQVSVQYASEQDYVTRKIQANVGADITVSVINATRAQTILDDIEGNVSGIQDGTMECTLEQPVRETYIPTTMKTIDPDVWLETAYYENSWFTGASVEDVFNQLRTKNQTVILERRVAADLDLSVGDEISIAFPSGARTLKIVALFGPEPSEMSGHEIYLQTWSFVPRNLFNMSSPFSDAYRLEDFETSILLKLNEGVNGTSVAEKIRNLGLEIYGVNSLDEELRSAMEHPTSDNSLQTLDVQRLGLVFAVLSASVGIALISIISMRERNREATLMSVKGLSYRQLVWMFLTENLAVVVFSVILGVVVGFIAGYGSVVSSSTVISELVNRQFVFTYDSLVTVVSCIALIFAATILPIIVMSRQYVTKLERMIRLR
jgi:ABC-type antimicrobial peptide transport system permease subunit